MIQRSWSGLLQTSFDRPRFADHFIATLYMFARRIPFGHHELFSLGFQIPPKVRMRLPSNVTASAYNVSFFSSTLLVLTP